MKKTTGRLIILSCLLMSPLSYADSWEPSHNCMEPVKPYEFTDQWELDNFNDEVQYYLDCINEFVEEQNDAIRSHNNAAENAIQDWKNFKLYNL